MHGSNFMVHLVLKDGDVPSTDKKTIEGFRAWARGAYPAQ